MGKSLSIRDNPQLRALFSEGVFVGITGTKTMLDAPCSSSRSRPRPRASTMALDIDSECRETTNDKLNDDRPMSNYDIHVYATGGDS